MSDLIERLKSLAVDMDDESDDENYAPGWAEEVQEAADEIARLRGLLWEAREDWIKVGYGASHEDVAAFRDFCARIDAVVGTSSPQDDGTADQPVICTHDGSAVPDDSGGWFCADCGYVSAANQPTDALEKFARDLAAAQTPLDPAAAKVLRENLHDLYMDGGTSDNGSAG